MSAVRAVASRPLVLACGALTRDLRVALALGGLDDALDVEYLPSALHNRPERIPVELAPRLEAAVADGRAVFVAYADCGTGGGLDALLARHPGVVRLPGAHCYEVFAGAERFAALHHAEPGTFYLTDYLARHFDQLVWVGLGLDRHPELRDAYFGNYARVVHLAQSEDPVHRTAAQHAAARLGLPLSVEPTGVEGLAAPIDHWSAQHAPAR